MTVRTRGAAKSKTPTQSRNQRKRDTRDKFVAWREEASSAASSGGQTPLVPPAGYDPEYQPYTRKLRKDAAVLKSIYSLPDTEQEAAGSGDQPTIKEEEEATTTVKEVPPRWPTVKEEQEATPRVEEVPPRWRTVKEENRGWVAAEMSRKEEDMVKQQQEATPTVKEEAEEGRSSWWGQEGISEVSPRWRTVKEEDRGWVADEMSRKEEDLLKQQQEATPTVKEQAQEASSSWWAQEEAISASSWGWPYLVPPTNAPRMLQRCPTQHEIASARVGGLTPPPPPSPPC